ncbi:heavy metal sensor histidine kinase [Curvibacter sp. APW13]|uniref:heavy metal sensor histidine kinase n=1 Tax=Curvibacter sp. APW13 TaxID=3077236 RepID=UPI0028E09E47|nr:heavy metal sensor histidine kinase [Curvibacter sp. APW13]MDT8992529.1 heavy metal sensor histidine kinase [Curvibacter sp. APW13]
MARLSLTARLTLLFALGSSAVLLVLGWLVGMAVNHHFEQQDFDALAGKLQLAQHAIERVSAKNELDALPSQLQDALIGHQDLAVQIVGPGGEVLLQTPGVVFPAERLAMAPTRLTGRLFQWEHDGRSFRGTALKVATATPQSSMVVVAVGLDIGHHQMFIHNLMRALWVFVACAALAMGFIGWLAASRGLAPLRSMRAQLTDMTAHRLHERLPETAVPPELAELTASLNAMLERLQDAFKRLSDFSSDIAHELRTPISNLMTETQVALSRSRDADSYRATLESNAEEYERLARMIADMLLLAKAEYGQMGDWIAAHGERVDLAQEVRNLFDFYEALAEDKGVRLELQGACQVWGDRLMLRRAVSNLLSNALRYTPQGGAVRVELGVEGERALLVVENPGPTIDAAHLPHLFERFYRADPSRQQATGEGTGLGLAITQAVVQAHGGSIQASSDNGLTRFSMALPVKQT